MNVTKPSVEIIDMKDYDEMIRKIEKIGRVCYKSEGNITEESAERFIRNILKRGHESVIEHEAVTVRMICDRGITHEIVRHRIASYSQESTRYCNYSGDKFGNEITVIDIAGGFSYDLNNETDLQKYDEEAPYLVNVPDGNLYKATNGGRSVVLTFNETVVRGSGAITYDVTKGDLTSYANGTIESVVINNESVTITLPESVVFDENEAVSYVFLDFAEGAFADAGGNVSAALVGGVDEETQTVAAPYWEYKAGTNGGGVEIEIDEAKGYGEYVFAGLAATSQDVYAEELKIYPGAKIPELTGGQAFDHQYGIVGLGSNFMDDASRYGICPANISEDGSALQVETFMKEGAVLCDIGVEGSRYYLVAVVGTYEQATGKFSMSKDEFVSFMPDAEEPAQLNTEKVIAYLIVDPTSGSAIGFAEVFTNPMILPYRLIASAQVAMSLEPSVNRAMKINSIKAQLQSSYHVPLMKVRR